MRFYTREGDGESSWAPVAIIMTVLVIALLFGYMFWYAPLQTTAAGPTHTVTVNNPAPSSSTPTTVVVPSAQGPSGAQGAAGPPGQAGAAGADGASGADGSAGTKGAQGDPGDTGPAGKPGNSTDNAPSGAGK